MRNTKLLWSVVAVVLTVMGTVAGLTSASAAGPVRHHALPATAQVVVRPVTWTARVAPGFTVSHQTTGWIDCTAAMPSPGAVDRDILECSPAAEYATACWLSRTPHQTLCLRDPRKNQLVSIRRHGVMAQSLPAPAGQRGPLGVRLADGTYCGIRIGGSSASLQGHPNYGITYYCQNGQALWAPFTNTSWGINRSHPTWTVRAAPANGHGALHTRNLAKVWFVGMHS